MSNIDTFNQNSNASHHALSLLTIVMPARDEAENVEPVIKNLYAELVKHNINNEIIVIDDGSSDDTWSRLNFLKEEISSLRPIKNNHDNGFGNAVVKGIDSANGDALIIMMADGSDDPRDAVKYWKTLNKGWDCVFGSRFIKGGSVVDYPTLKLILNRLANWVVMLFFQIKLNDTTNAFKAYRMSSLRGCRPFLSPHFNLTIELPLKAIVRGYSWTTMPISWRNRRHGAAKLKINEMGSRYFFIFAYVWLEKHFSKSDYKKHPVKK